MAFALQKTTARPEEHNAGYNLITLQDREPPMAVVGIAATALNLPIDAPRQVCNPVGSVRVQYARNLRENHLTPPREIALITTPLALKIHDRDKEAEDNKTT